MDISILIVNWNTRDLLDDCLHSVYDTVHGIDFEVVVVDNASGDGSAEMVAEKHTPAKLIANSENVGFAAANNQAYRVSSGDYVLLLNPDTVVREDAITRLLTVARENESRAAVAPKLLWSDGSVQPSVGEFPTISHELLDALCLTRMLGRKHSSRFFVPRRDDIRDIPWACGACLLVRRKAVTGNNILDERYFMFSEETDLCKSLTDRGWRVCYEPGAVVVHLGGASTSMARQEMLAQLYESRFLYFAKHHGMLYANVYRLGVLPLHLLVRTAGYLPSLLARQPTYTLRQTHPLSQLRVLADLTHWSAKPEVDS